MKKYIVTLTAEERQTLLDLIAAGKAAALKLTHARILLKADSAEGGPAWPDHRIAEALEVSDAREEFKGAVAKSRRNLGDLGKIHSSTSERIRHAANRTTQRWETSVCHGLGTPTPCGEAWPEGTGSASLTLGTQGQRPQFGS